MKRIQIKNEVAAIRKAGWFLVCTYALCFLLFAPGCGNKFFDPTQVGRFRSVPAVNVILETLGVSEEAPVAWEQAQEPKPADTVVMESDYALRAGDVVRISIFELLQEGVPFVNEYVVTETGKISIPEVGVVEAAGLTETQLEEEIRQILSPSILKEPSIVATLMTSQQRTYSVLGDGVLAPGRYVIPRYGFRLADALATAGGPRQFNVSYIYVSRYIPGKEAAGAPAQPQLEGTDLTEPELTVPELIKPEDMTKPEQEPLEVITPRVQRPRLRSREVIASTEMITERELAQAGVPESLEMLSDGQQNWKDNGKKANSSAGAKEPQATEESIEDEPVSVRDILKTLSERPRRERTTTSRTTPTASSVRRSAEPSGSEVMVELPPDERVDVNDVSSLPEPPVRAKTNGQASVKPPSPVNATTRNRVGVQGTVKPSNVVSANTRERTGERVNVNDVLKTLSERRRTEKVDEGTDVEVVGPSPEPTVPEKAAEETDVDAILKSLSTRRRPGVNKEAAVEPVEEPVVPAAPRKMDKNTDIDAMLKSLSEQQPQAEEKVEEAVAPAPVEGPIGPERLDERIDVDEILKTLPGRAPRRKVVAPIEEPAVGIDETIKSLVEPGVPETPEEEIVVEDTGVPAASVKPVAPGKAEGDGRIEWVFQDGKWVPVQVGAPKAIGPVIKFEPGKELVEPLEEKAVTVPEVEWAETAKTRLIRIPSDKLMAGDSRYNIVIKPGDTIHVPVDIIGEFCVMGNVNNQGYVPITGRPMTLKMAVAAAGGLGPLAWPKKCEVVRRVGKKKEEIVMVDLDKIANGEQPDFFIKPNDLINVGTHATSRWRAILRNAFRATYGFGFVYDRNFADRDYGNGPLPNWF